MSKRLEELGFNRVEVKQAKPGIRYSEPKVTLTKSKQGNRHYNKIYINGNAAKQLGWAEDTRVDLYWNREPNKNYVFALKPANVGCLTAHKGHSSSGLIISSLNACLEIHSKSPKEVFEASIEDGVLFFK